MSNREGQAVITKLVEAMEKAPTVEPHYEGHALGQIEGLRMALLALGWTEGEIDVAVETEARREYQARMAKVGMTRSEDAKDD